MRDYSLHFGVTSYLLSCYCLDVVGMSKDDMPFFAVPGNILKVEEKKIIRETEIICNEFKKLPHIVFYNTSKIYPFLLKFPYLSFFVFQKSRFYWFHVLMKVDITSSKVDTVDNKDLFCIEPFTETFEVYAKEDLNSKYGVQKTIHRRLAYYDKMTDYIKKYREYGVENRLYSLEE